MSTLMQLSRINSSRLNIDVKNSDWTLGLFLITIRKYSFRTVCPTSGSPGLRSKVHMVT